LGHLTRKIVPKMTTLGGTLNPTIPYRTILMLIHATFMVERVADFISRYVIGMQTVVGPIHATDKNITSLN